MCVKGTRWEGQAETPRGFQDPQHEVKHGPLGWTALLRARTHTHRKIRTGMLRNVSAHVKRGHWQVAHVDTHTQRGVMGVWSTHAWRPTRTFCQRFVHFFYITLVRNRTWKETHTDESVREGYSQAQNTRAEFILQPDWLQHVSDELQLNTHRDTHMLVLREGDARLDSNETFCSSHRPGNFAQHKHLVWNTCNLDIFFCYDEVFFLSSLPYFVFLLPIFLSSEQEQRNGSGCDHEFQHASSRTRPHHFTTHLSASSFECTWLVRTVPAACWNARTHTRAHTPYYHTSSLSHLL